jgi:hypothetical protein
MKNSILTIAMLTMVSFSSMANNIDENTLWNNTGKGLTFKKGDTVKIKNGSKSSAYVLSGKVEHICNKSYIKVNGYFVAISDVEVITKYNTVK